MPVSDSAVSARPDVSSTTRSRPRALAAFAALALITLSPLAGAQSGPSLGFDEALRLAQAQAPQLAAQQLSLGAAEASVGPASQLPDPKLLLGIDNLPVSGPDRLSLTRDFMTMRRIGFMQDFPREEKRRLRGDKARAEADKERAMLSALAAEVQRDAAAAWLDTWFAQVRVKALGELVPETELLREVAQAQLAGGKGSAADPIAARAGQVALQDRIDEARRDVRRAQAMLARWVGAAAAARPLDAPPDLIALKLPPEEIISGIEHHPELAAWGPMEAMARAEAELARAAKKPDWSLEIAYAQREPYFANMASVAVRIDLPLWGATRQDPIALAREKQIEQVRANRDNARRMHEAEVRREVADWESARERAARIERELLPLAKERTSAALAAYRGGRGDLNAVLAARSNEIDTQLMAIQQQAELARAWANLNFLLNAADHRTDTK